MPDVQQVTVNLPADLIAGIDRQQMDRSAFVVEAVKNELVYRHEAELGCSIQNPHPDSIELAEEGFDDWVRQLPGGRC